MKILSSAIALSAALCAGALADDKAAAEKALETHLRNMLTLDGEKISAGYAGKVRLVEGHEFLKPEHGLVDGDADDTRSKPLVVTRDRYVAAMLKLLKGQDAPPKEVVDEMITAASFKALEPEAAAGDKKLDPADPVGSADGKLSFVAEKGDVFVKFQPQPGGDHAYFQFRKIGDRWLIVGEYAD